ncbi:MAG: AAA family ATPase [Bacilli bacterium]|nr:AAA family ATPase [Bacilli bacterium]
MEEGPEYEVPHFYANYNLVKELFKDFKIIDIHQKIEYFEKNEKLDAVYHYHILIKNSKDVNKMSKLYLITGPAGVGKSTISKSLAESKSKSVLIEGDEIYHHVVGGYVSPWKEVNHLDVFWKVVFSTINIYLSEGYDVIFNYIIEPDDLELIKDNFKDIGKEFIVLLVDEEKLLKRDSERPEDCQMKERCIELLNEFKEYNYDSKYIIDTSNISIEHIVKLINNDDRFNL